MQKQFSPPPLPDDDDEPDGPRHVQEGLHVQAAAEVEAAGQGLVQVPLDEELDFLK